jgi:hypothetical protein
MSQTQILIAIFVIALVALFLLGLLLFRSTAASPEQRFGFVAAVFVQLIGTIAFGAVVSYSLFSIQHAQEQSEKQRGDLDVAAANKKRVLGYIKAELSYDLDAIKKRGDALSLEIAIQQMPLKSDFWKISGLSGDLKWIDDVAILNSIADACFNIDNVHGWEVRLQDVATGPGLTIAITVNGQSMPMMNYVGSFVRQTYQPAISAIEAALAKL